ncbi:hypothetical protein KUTeg_022540 [Tegillarca granosa]|uniref:B box-type domain-containing protein n=1 Tax=Tegillarca granosa TaxID=220873 RepID=A0ABQ9E9D1_TEGGR|nr:hypothetical protein KUTeg_022540 [Tegillarca granosa]
MAENLKQDHLRPGDKPVCDLCDAKIDYQLSKCLVCNVYMCRTCTTAHQRVLASKKHNIVPRIERAPSKTKDVSQMCKTHKDEEIIFHCNPCNDYICSECILGDHKGHDGVKFKDFANQKRREMNVKLNQARISQKSEITKIIKHIEEKEKENDDNDKDTENQIENRMKQIIADVNKNINCLTEEKTKIHQQNKDKLEAVKSQVKQGSPNFNILCTEYSELLRTGSDMEVVMSETEMYQNLQSVPSVDTDIDMHIKKSCFVPGKTDDKTLVSLCGYVQSFPDEEFLSSQPEPGSSSIDSRYSKSSLGVQTHPESHSAETKLLAELQPERNKFSRDFSPNVRVMSSFSIIAECVQSICSLSDDSAIINYYMRCDCDVVSVDEQVKNTFKFDFLPGDIKMTSHDNIIVTDNRKPLLHKLTTKGVKTQTISTSPLRPVALCEATDGNLLVSLVDKPSHKVGKSSRRLVSRITMDGNTIESYEYQNTSRLFTWPHGVSENINKDICVVDRTSKTSGRLVVVDNKGKLRYTYDGQKLNHSFYPRDVKCDKSGHVIVNDRNNIKVHILDLNGQFIRYIADENILKDNPICLELDKNDIVWVGGSMGNVYRLRNAK